MTILIQNTTNDVKSICRFSGERVNISPKNFVIFDTDSADEAEYWAKQSTNFAIKAKGLNIVTDGNKIRLMKKLGTLTLVSETTATYTPNNNSNDLFAPTVENVEDATVEYQEEDNVITENVDTESDIDSVNNEDINNESAQELVNNASEADEVIPTEDVIDSVDSETEYGYNSEVETEDMDSDESNDVETVEENVETKYTEDYLRSLTKNELFTILDDNGIEYKQTFNKDTLISLILENCN